MILIDSNAWIYFLDAGLEEHVRVVEHLTDLVAEDDVLVPAVVQVEVLHYIAHQMGDAARGAAEVFLAFPGTIEPLDGGSVHRAARILLEHRDDGIGGRDAALLAAAKRHDARIATADRSLSRTAEALDVKTVDPTE